VSVADLVLKVRARADFNNGSVAVRRHIVESHAQLLKRLPSSIDNFVFASSLKAGGLMYFTDERLTLYRVHGENWSSAFWLKGSKKEEIQLRHARALLQEIKVYKLIGSSLLDDDINEYLCLERRNRGSLLLLPLPELGTLPPELRLRLSDIKLALRCYKVEAIDLVNVAFIMGLAFLSPLLATPRGRLIIGKLAEGVIKALATKRALRRARLR
jgi:hypothetical protein